MVPVTLTLVLAQEVHKMTPTRVEMRQRIRQIMETSILKPRGLHPRTMTGSKLISQSFKRSHLEVDNVVPSVARVPLVLASRFFSLG